MLHPFFILFCVEAKTDRRKHTDSQTDIQTDRERERGEVIEGEREGESK